MKKKIIKRTEDIKDFIGIYDGYLDKTLCDQVLKLFNNQKKFSKIFKRQEYHNVSSMLVKDKAVTIHKGNVENFTKTELNFLTIKTIS